MNNEQMEAAKEIVAQFLAYVEERGECPKETYKSPMSGKIQRNAVTIDVRQLKILAGLPVNKVGN